MSLEGTSQSLAAILRTHAKSATELGRIADMREPAIRIHSNLERKWIEGTADGKEESSLQPVESKECEKLVIDSLLRKADLLSEAGRSDEAIDTLESSTLGKLTKASPPALIHLATKVGSYCATSPPLSVFESHRSALATSLKGTICFDLLPGVQVRPARDNEAGRRNGLSSHQGG